jgi:hypothetical protein
MAILIPLAATAFSGASALGNSVGGLSAIAGGSAQIMTGRRLVMMQRLVDVIFLSQKARLDRNSVEEAKFRLARRPRINQSHLRDRD